MPRWVRKIFLKVFDRYTLLKKNGFSFNLPATFNLLISVNLIYRCILSLKIFHSSIVLGHYSLGYFITEYFTKFLVDPWFLSVFTELLRITDLNLIGLGYWRQILLPFSHWTMFMFSTYLQPNEMIIPTTETVRQRYFLDLFLSHEKPLLLVGPTGTGKSAITNNYILRMPAEK